MQLEKHYAPFVSCALGSYIQENLLSIEVSFSQSSLEEASCLAEVSKLSALGVDDLWIDGGLPPCFQKGACF